MIIGFTGTREGMTKNQKAWAFAELLDLVHSVGRGRARVVHGDCVGADADFDWICVNAIVTRGIRPCTFENMRAHCEDRGAEVLAPPKPAMQRNRDIVADADVLIACPPNFERIKKGSGTWATIGFAEEKGIKVIVVFPDGSTRVTEAR